ncbi:MAG: twin transmembrane helix small protein [Alphaproteobacteria bacterium]|nr:MAG: twin transmembrane helix small protein [Alphaproteobacteria bacterium]
MNGFLVTLVVLALLATLGVLLTGVVVMLRGGEFNRKYGNRLMRWRVILQGSALLLLAITLMLAKG